MKSRSPLLALCLAGFAFAQTSCVSRLISTSSDTLKSFSPRSGKNKVVVMTKGDLSRYRSSDPVEPMVKGALTAAIRAKGWEVVDSPKQADYGLIWKEQYYGSSHSGYSVYGDTAMENRLHSHACVGILKSVKPDGSAGQDVWRGYAGLATRHLREESYKPQMASLLIEREFPAAGGR
jgi:hypothetical protein